ncbi:MAG TPA: DnaJ domain-containing protein [Alphaproteobacteria bacterium]
MDNQDDLYHILGIPATSSPKAIHKAYQVRFRELQLSGQNPESLQKIRDAYTILRNPDTRAQYDFKRLNHNARFSYIPPNPKEREELKRYLWTNLKVVQETAFMKFNDSARKIDEPIGAKDVFNIKANLVWKYMKERYKYNFFSHTGFYAAKYIVPAMVTTSILNTTSSIVLKTPHLGLVAYLAIGFGTATATVLGALAAMHTVGPAANTAGAVIGNVLSKRSILKKPWENEKGISDGVRRTRQIADSTYRSARVAFFVAATLGASAGFLSAYKPLRQAFTPPVVEVQSPEPTIS